MSFLRKIKRGFLLTLKFYDEVLWAKKLGVKVGEDCRLLGVTFSTEPYLVEIGNHVSATKVHFETHDGGMWVFRDKHPEWDKIKGIKIGNNVYLGRETLIMPGVNIGDNVIVGAKSLVTKDIPNNTVAAGVPARIIKTTEEYYNKIAEEVIQTKQLSGKEKKDYLLSMQQNS